MRYLLLTLLLFVGFQLPHCVSDDDDCGVGPGYGRYFDIQGLRVWPSDTGNFYPQGEDAQYAVDSLPPGADALFDAFYLHLLYEADYVAEQSDPGWELGLQNSAWACSPLPRGSAGAKSERLDDLVITTRYDYPPHAMAGDTISRLFSIYDQAIPGYLRTDVYLDEHRAALPEFQGLLLQLNTPSDSTAIPFAVDVAVALSNGERYTARSAAVVLR